MRSATASASASAPSGDYSLERQVADLEELRDHFDLGAKSAKAYCDDWRAAGILVR